MDPFTQRMLEKAEQRSRALGISNASKIPMAEVETSNNDAAASYIIETKTSKAKQHNPVNISSSNNSISSNMLQVVEKSTPITSANSSNSINNSSKMLRQFSAVDKENMDLGIEINVISDKNVEVQVEVEEQEISNEDFENKMAILNQQPVSCKLRDTSRNRLQRLGALYSNKDDLSSPIHRTEAQFHADSDETFNNKKTNKQQKFGKLAALAHTINEWEDDVGSSIAIVPPPKPELRSRPVSNKKAQAPQPPTPQKQTSQLQSQQQQQQSSTKETNKVPETTKLKWDAKVINSLEAQGFQRRESSTIKYAYDYAKNTNEEESHVEKSQPKPIKVKTTGLVSDRAAVFEKASQDQQDSASNKTQKDPTELSLKERRLLFEKNKGEALIPKAAFGMAPPISKIRQDVTTALKKEEALIQANNNVTKVVTNADSKVRNKVAALLANVNTTNNNKINNDIQNQRQIEMEELSNRFNKQKQIFSKESTTTTTTTKKTFSKPPPPPPPPMAISNIKNSLVDNTIAKRRSPANDIENDDEESKRARREIVGIHKNGHRIYPALSEIESQSEVDDDIHKFCTTPTASAYSTTDEHETRNINIRRETQQQQQHQQRQRLLRNHIEEEKEEEEEHTDRCAEGCYSCLLCLLCIE